MNNKQTHNIIKLPRDKIINYNMSGKYDNEIILQLQKIGFSVSTNNKNSNIPTLNVISGNETDWCKGSSAKKLENITYKLTNPETGQPFVIIEDSGWTAKCGFNQKNIFAKMAIKLNNYWDNPTGTDSWLSW